MNSYRLYGTSACHLCEIAEEMLQALREQGRGVEFEKVDIADSDSLFERYGLVVPVLCDSQGRELFWPFDLEGLCRFIAAD